MERLPEVVEPLRGVVIYLNLEHRLQLHCQVDAQVEVLVSLFAQIEEQAYLTLGCTEVEVWFAGELIYPCDTDMIFTPDVENMVATLERPSTTAPQAQPKTRPSAPSAEFILVEDAAQQLMQVTLQDFDTASNELFAVASPRYMRGQLVLPQNTLADTFSAIIQRCHTALSRLSGVSTPTPVPEPAAPAPSPAPAVVEPAPAPAPVATNGKAAAASKPAVAKKTTATKSTAKTTKAKAPAKKPEAKPPQQ